MPAPTFSLTTTGTDPKQTTTEILEAEVNRVVGIVFDQANPEDAVAAADSADASASSAAEAKASENAAAASEDSAETARNQAQNLAEAGALSASYATKAAADTALAGLADGAFIAVLSDESRGGRLTTYRVASGAFVFVPLFPSTKTVYYDPDNGDDADDGLTRETAKATQAAAVAAMSAGDTLAVARGSRTFGRLGDLPAGCNVIAYGFGPKPIIDGSREIADAWIADGSNTYYNEVTHETALDMASNPLTANGPWFMLWAEGPQFGAEGEPLTPYFDGATQADNITYVKANPGTFTCYQVGSSVADPRTDTTGTQVTYRYYAHLSDDSDPDASGTAIYYGEAGGILVLSTGMNVDGLTVQRTITKDMTGDGQNGGGLITNCDLLDAAVHAYVGFATGRNNRIVSRMASAYDQGGGWHNFRSTATLGTSPGGFIEDSYIEGFNNAVWSHGTGGDPTLSHATMAGRRLRIRRCGSALATDGTTNGRIFEDIDAVDCRNLSGGGLGGKTIIRRSRWLSPEGADTYTAVNLNGDVELEGVTLIFRGSDPTGNLLARNAKAQIDSNASLFYTLTMDRCTVVNGNWTTNSFWQQVNLVATDSILGNVYIAEGAFGGDNTNRTMDLTNCQLEYDSKTLAEIQAIFAGVGSDCVVPHVLQTAKQTIAAGDITWRDTTRTGGATSGDATLTTNAGIGVVLGQGIRILDYDGAGGTWTTTVAAITSTTEYELTDAPDATFSGKAVETAYAANVYWSSAAAVTTATITYDGTTVTPADADWIDAGTYLYLTGLGRADPVGVVQVASKAAGVLTLEDAVSWSTTGGRNEVVPLPSFNVQYQFPTIKETALINIDRSGGAGVGDVTDLAETTDGRGRFDDSNYRRLSDLTNESGGGQIKNEVGEIDLAIPVGEGDVVTITSNAYIADYAPRFAVDPATAGMAPLATGSVLAKKGMGAR